MVFVFDLGGVVLNWQPLALIRQVLPHRAPDAHSAQNAIGQIFESFNPQSDWAQFDLGLIEPAPLAAKIAKRVGWPQAEITQLIASVPKHLNPVQETVQLMADLKQAGHTLYYLSNMPAPYADHLERHHDFFQHFTDGIFSARVNCIKPHPRMFDMAERQFNLSGVPCIFLDDVAHNINAAKAQGWAGYCFEDAAQIRQILQAQGLLSN